MILPSSTLGRKIIMAITGQVLVFFIIIHIAGNSTIFFHNINAYAAALHAYPPLVWMSRLVLFASFASHIWYGTVLKLENRAAKPQPYAVTNYRSATFAGRNQIWTGAVIAAFLIYHLLQFTLRLTNPEISADTHRDALGRPDVFMMVVRSFEQIGISGVYMVSLAALGLHLLHGIQSSFQTWGLTNDRSLPVIDKSGTAASVLLFMWYIAIPLSIVAGILK